MLFEESGVLPKFAAGGATQEQMTPQQMIAMLIAHGYEPQKFGIGGVVNAGVQGLSLVPEGAGLYKGIKNNNAGQIAEHGVGLADTAASMASIPYTVLSYLLSSGDVGAGTLDSLTPAQLAELDNFRLQQAQSIKQGKKK